jgi:hypothetical protein
MNGFINAYCHHIGPNESVNIPCTSCPKLDYSPLPASTGSTTIGPTNNPIGMIGGMIK